MTRLKCLDLLMMKEQTDSHRANQNLINYNGFLSHMLGVYNAVIYIVFQGSNQGFDGKQKNYKQSHCTYLTNNLDAELSINQEIRLFPRTVGNIGNYWDILGKSIWS